MSVTHYENSDTIILINQRELNILTKIQTNKEKETSIYIRFVRSEHLLEYCFILHVF